MSLGLGYSTLTPIFENSDETLHYPYVKHLADGQGLPLATPGQLWNQEGTQPPLYYAIVAASTFWIDTDNLAEHLQRNPHWLFTEVRSLLNDNQNLVLHGPMDTFPYRRAALAIHIGRWWSLLFGLVTVIGTFLIGQHLFPGNLPLVVTATALTGLTPQFIRVSATVSNDSLSAALTTLAVLAAFKFTTPPTQAAPLLLRPHAPLLLGLLCGLALLTKLSSLSIFFIVVVILFGRLFFLSEFHEMPLRRLVSWLLLMGLITAGLTGWWFIRNYQLYGEWLATDIHLDLAGRSDLSLAEVWRLRAEAERAYWATFGWGQIRPPEWVYQGLFWFSRIGLIGLGLALFAKLIQGNHRRPLPLNLAAIDFEKTALLLIWAGLNLLLYLRWVMSVGSVSHTRLVFPAITAISLLLALGWHALLPRRWAGWFSGLILALFLALNLYSLVGLLYPAFRPNETETLTVEANPLNVTFLQSMALSISRVYPQQQTERVPKPQRAAKPGDVIIIEATWQVLHTMNRNYSVAATLLAPDGRVLAQRETYPGLGLRPTRYLQPGDTFIDRYPLRLDVSSPTRLDTEIIEPMVAQATLTLFDFESETRAGFPALDVTGNEVTPIAGQVKLVPQVWPTYEPTYRTEATFANAITLIGYDLPTPDQPGLTLYWQSEDPVSADYVVFLHLLDAAGNIIAQADAPPTNNAYPTSWWASGETIADRRQLPLTPETVTLRLGLYDLATGDRLPLSHTTLPAQDNAVEITLP